MLEYFFKSRWYLQNLRQEPLSKHIDGLAARFNRIGFTRGSGRRYLCLTGKFNDFARAGSVATAEQITELLIERFIKEEIPFHGIFKQARPAMHQLWEYLCEEKITTRSATTLCDDPFDIILCKYASHLSNERGLVPTSCSQYLRYARKFLSWLQDHRGEKALDRVNGVDILEFITEFAGCLYLQPESTTTL